MHIDTLARVLVCVIFYVCVCALVIVFEVRKKETCISVPMLYSEGHTSTGLNISIINCDKEEFYFFIYFILFLV